MSVRLVAKMVLVLAGVGTLAVGVSRSGMLGVSSIDVRGAEMVSIAEIRDVSGLELGQNALTIDLGAARDQISLLPLVASVTVRRDGSLGIVIEVSERRAALRSVEGDRETFLDRDGVVVPAPASEITIPSLVGPRPDDETRLALLLAWRSLTGSERRAVSFESTPRGLVMDMGPTTVVLGDGSWTRLKLDTLRDLRARLRAGDRLQSVDLTDPNRPTVRLRNAA